MKDFVFTPAVTFRLLTDLDPASPTSPELAEPRFRLFSERLAVPVRPIRDRWYAAWRAVADAVAADDRAGVVLALAGEAAMALRELDHVVREWSIDADELATRDPPPRFRPVYGPPPPLGPPSDRGQLDRWLADRDEFGGWARAMADDGSPLGQVRRITNTLLAPPAGGAGRACELLGWVADGVPAAELIARLTTGGVGWLGGLTAAVAAAVVPPAPGYQFRTDELSAGRRPDIDRLLRHAAGVVARGHVDDFRRRYLPPAAADPPPAPPADPPAWITRHFLRDQQKLLLALWGREAVSEVELCRRLGYRKRRTAAKNLQRRVNQTNTNLATRRDAVGGGWEIESAAAGDAPGYRLRRLAD